MQMFPKPDFLSGGHAPGCPAFAPLLRGLTEKPMPSNLQGPFSSHSPPAQDSFLPRAVSPGACMALLFMPRSVFPSTPVVLFCKGQEVTSELPGLGLRIQAPHVLPPACTPSVQACLAHPGMEEGLLQHLRAELLAPPWPQAGLCSTADQPCLFQGLFGWKLHRPSEQSSHLGSKQHGCLWVTHPA